MTRIILCLFIQTFCIVILSCKTLAHECFSNSDQFYCQLSTRTPYRFIANLNESQPNYPGCTAKKIWLIIRHGTRFPGKKHIKSMINNLPELQEKIIENFHDNKSELSAELIEQLNNWKLSFDHSYTMVLTNEGENELIDLAERMQARFPTIFVKDYDPELYKFKHTATQRTENSAKFFVLGLFGQYQSANISFPEPENEDPILRFYKRCRRWRKEVKNNKESYKEKDLFVNGNIFQKILSDISKRVGFEVDYEKVKLIYMICAFETAWNETTKSPWCDILTLNDIQVLEFIDDLEYYWTNGYGYNLNYDQACPALNDVFTFFDSTDKTLVTTYFTHSGTILKLLSRLGIAKDKTPLTHESYLLHKDSRNWRLNLIDAFASNIAFVLYDCKVQGPSILVLHQERVVHIPGCPTETLCPMAIMKHNYPDTAEECPFDEICSIESK